MSKKYICKPCQAETASYCMCNSKRKVSKRYLFTHDETFCKHMSEENQKLVDKIKKAMGVK
jgi:hypothetical protein